MVVVVLLLLLLLLEEARCSEDDPIQGVMSRPDKKGKREGSRQAASQSKR